MAFLYLHTFIIWALIIFINFMMGPDNYLVNDLLISNFGPRGHWTLQLLERREIVHTKWSIHTYEHVTWPTICEGDPAPPPDWLGSLDSFPQEHLTMFSPMTVPFTPQIALVADSLLENLQQIFFSFICTAVVTDSLFNFQIYNNQAINKHNKFFYLLNFSKEKEEKSALNFS